MISSQQVSVVIQGNIEEKLTYECLLSVRKYLPMSEIILSTWEGADTSSVTGLYDILVINKDPGGFLFNKVTQQINNNNRMCLSTQEGLKYCKRKYTLKLRSDLILKNNNILKYAYDSYHRTSKYKLFKQRIIANNIFTFKYEEGEHGERHYRPFHVSDWWFFGLTKDIKLLFDIPLAKEPEFSQYFAIHKFPSGRYHRFPDAKWKFSPEQYIQIECIKKHFKDIQCEHILDYNEINIEQSEIFIVNNYQIICPEDSGIYPEKERYKRYNYKNDITTCHSIYTREMWLCDYHKYCCPKHKLPLRYCWKEKLKVCRYVEKLQKHFRNFMYPLNCFLHKCHKFIEWLLEPLSMLYYLFKIIFKILTRFHRLFK